MCDRRQGGHQPLSQAQTKDGLIGTNGRPASTRAHPPTLIVPAWAQPLGTSGMTPPGAVHTRQGFSSQTQTTGAGREVR